MVKIYDKKKITMILNYDKNEDTVSIINSKYSNVS